MSKPKPFTNCIFCNTYFLKSQSHQSSCSITCAFLSRVNKLGVDECWHWTGSTHKAGYGEFRFLGKLYRAHRFALEYHNNYLLSPDDQACHKCDNPICCNPHHLFKGTAWDNLNDAAKKLRMAKRLTKEEVIQIKELLQKGLPKGQIASKFNVSNTNIYHIESGHTWTHVT